MGHGSLGVLGWGMGAWWCRWGMGVWVCWGGMGVWVCWGGPCESGCVVGHGDMGNTELQYNILLKKFYDLLHHCNLSIQNIVSN